MKIKLKKSEEEEKVNPYTIVTSEDLDSQVCLVENELDNFMIYIFEECKFEIPESYFSERKYISDYGEINDFFDAEVYKIIQILRKNEQIKLPFVVVLWYLMNGTKNATAEKRNSRIAIALMARMSDTYRYITSYFDDKTETIKNKLTIRGLYGQEAKKNLRNLF